MLQTEQFRRNLYLSVPRFFKFEAATLLESHFEHNLLPIFLS